MHFSKNWIAAAACLAAAASAHATPAFSLSTVGGVQSLISFDTATPGTVTTVGAISGATTSLNGIDFRPANGLLYGYNAATSGIYTVNTMTGATSLVSTSTAPVTTPLLGIDFNPAADRLRIVTANEENRRINVATGAQGAGGATPDGPLGTDPNRSIVGAAYTFNDNNPATGTVLYYLDSASDTLLNTNMPNGAAGTPLGPVPFTTLGSLGVDFDETSEFDIFTNSLGGNTAFANLRVGGINGLYTIDLATGAASLIGTIGAGGLTGLALATIPEPGTWALLLMAGGAAAWSARRRRPQAQADEHASLAQPA